ncbi:class I SAM-dependent methyltransferase [Halobacteriales archaeon QH_3_68_24]|nr:MAG: class I SAM-dependent methyltransferase [Halobacteriales archaeon QH_3_68_24]
MSDATDRDTIDWDRFWAEADETERAGATASAHHAHETLRAFLDARVPDLASLADVGCGPGHVAFGVAERHPDAAVVGYDVAGSIVTENRERARESDLGTLRFERTVLPEFDPDRTFDVVFCYATLSYVADPERAIRTLHDAVEPGGYLVCSYPNTLAQVHYRRVAEAPEEHLPEDSGFDPDRYPDRFRLLIEGESLLSYDRIHDILETWPQSVWRVVEQPDGRYAWRHHPMVFVPK